MLRLRQWSGCFGVLVLLLSVIAHSPTSAEGNNEGDGVQSAGPAGGVGGTKDWATATVPADCTIRSITFKVGKAIDQVRITYVDAKGESHDTEAGGPGGNEWLKPLEVPAGVRVVGITVRSGRFLDSVTVHLSNGDSKRFAGTQSWGTEDRRLMLPKKDGKYVGRFMGFFGRSARKMDSIGIKYDSHD